MLCCVDELRRDRYQLMHTDTEKIPSVPFPFMRSSPMMMSVTLDRGRQFLAVIALTVGGIAGAADDKVELKPGDAAPAFKGVDAQGNPWNSADHVGKKYVVVYFYPGDFTPGCTAQARSLRDNMNKLAEKGIVVVGISGDSVKTHQMFTKAQQLNFMLLADEDGNLAKQFGVPVGKGAEVIAKGADGKPLKDAEGKPVKLTRNVTAARWTFVLDKDGKIASKNTKVIPAQDAKAVADLIDKLQNR
jgi:thioredoxin-dependent peroxiredoxin